MTILLTGGTGFIGSHLAQRLVKEKHRVILLKRQNSNTWRIQNILDKLILINIEDFDNLDQVFEVDKIDLVIHLATKYIKQESSQKDLTEILNGNIVFPSLLLASAIKYNVKAFINTGTCFEYKFSNQPISEKTKLSPYNFYATSKILFEEMLKYQAKKYNFKAITLKLFYPYGEKDNPKLIQNLIDSLINKKQISLNKTNPELSFTYVDDIVDAYIKSIIFLNQAKSAKYEVFNIGSNQVHNIKSIVNTLEKISGKSLNIKYTNKSDSIKYVLCNPNKAQNILNWKQTYSLEKGLSKVYNYYLKTNK